MRTYYRSPMFEDTYHVTHGQKTGDIFRNNLIQKFKIGFNLSTETTSLGIISLDSLRPRKRPTSEDARRTPYAGYALCRYDNKSYRDQFLFCIVRTLQQLWALGCILIYSRFNSEDLYFDNM